MLDETLDGVGDVMLDEEQASTFDTLGDSGAAFHVDLFQEHSLDGNSNEGADLPDGDLFCEHFQNEVDFDGMYNYSDNTESSVRAESYANF